MLIGFSSFTTLVTKANVKKVSVKLPTNVDLGYFTLTPEGQVFHVYGDASGNIVDLWTVDEFLQDNYEITSFSGTWSYDTVHSGLILIDVTFVFPHTRYYNGDTFFYP